MTYIVKRQSDVDLAYHLLLEHGQGMYFRDLISLVLAKKQERIQSHAHAIAEVHTQINMDSRFVYLGKGVWGLADWVPQRGIQYVAETAATVSDADMRREKLLEEIQQDYVTAPEDTEERE